MRLQDKLIRQYMPTSEEYHTGSFIIPSVLQVKNFKTAIISVFGEEGTDKYNSNIQTAHFIMNEFTYFIEHAIDYMIREKYVPSDAIFNEELNLLFNASDMNYYGKVVDCTICFEELKHISSVDNGKKRITHCIYVNFDRDTRGNINYGTYYSSKFAYNVLNNKS